MPELSLQCKRNAQVDSKLVSIKSEIVKVVNVMTGTDLLSLYDNLY